MSGETRAPAAMLHGEDAPAADAYEPPIDWVLRPFAAPGRSPWLVATALAFGFLIVSQCVRLTLFGLPPGPAWREIYPWLDFLSGVVFAYIPTAMWILRRGRACDLRTLRPHLRDGVSYRALADAALGVPRSGTVASLMGALVLGLVPVVDPGFWDFPRPPVLHPLVLFFTLRMAVTGWIAGRAIAAEARALVAFARIGARDVRVDLMDLRPFAVFARVGLRSALSWVIVSSLISLFWLGPGAPLVNGVIVVALVAGVSVGFYACIEGAHRAIAAAKRDALAAVESRIARASAALMTGRADEADGARLADLV
ncbi:MAG TPA: hypothetical protein VMS55_23495, partial [Myxococcota bacterium]|nr:hypothetical protein [Myxococcota bacterium]